MSSPRLLPGGPSYPSSPAEQDPFKDLQEECLRLQREVSQLKSSLREAQRTLEERDIEVVRTRQTVSTLRGQLAPLYNGLRGLFEEMDAGGFSSPSASSSSSPAPTTGGGAGVWDKWKAKLGGVKGEIIAALETGPKTRSQLRAILACGMTTIDKAIYQLRDMGLLVKAGAGGWMLKE